MPVNPCYTEKDLNHISIFFPDELDSICSVLREITISEEMRTAHACIILWCADSIEKLGAVLAKEIKAKHN